MRKDLTELNFKKKGFGGADRQRGRCQETEEAKTDSEEPRVERGKSQGNQKRREGIQGGRLSNEKWLREPEKLGVGRNEEP